MPKFELKPFKAASGKIPVCFLIKNEKCQVEEYLTEFGDKGNKKAKSITTTLISRIKEVADGNRNMPGTKYHPVNGSKQGVLEFKAKQLRCYGILSQNKYILILLCGKPKPKEQQQDIDRAEKIAEEYDKFLKSTQHSR